MFPIDVHEKLIFTKAVYYNFHPVPVKKPWLDLSRLEKNGTLESVKYYDAERTSKNFAIRASY